MSAPGAGRSKPDRFAIVKGVAFTRDDLARAAVIERLMCDFSVDYGEIAENMLGDAAAFDGAQDQFGATDPGGRCDPGGTARLDHRAGRPFMRLVAAAFDAYLAARAARHSVAV